MKKLCTVCGHTGKAKRVTRGSLLLELFLWGGALLFLLLIPFIGFGALLMAALYSVWRLTSKRQACRLCGGSPVIPLNSPVAKRILQQNAAQAATRPGVTFPRQKQ